MRKVDRLLALLTFPLCYLVLGYVSSDLIATGERSMVGAAIADVALMWLPSVVIYLVSLLFVRRALRELTTGELAAGSLLVGLLASVLIVVSIMLLSLMSTSHLADEAFFIVVPVVPPVIACWLALRIMLAWHRRRVART